MGLQWEADYQDPEHEVATPAEPLEHGNWCHIPTLCYWSEYVKETSYGTDPVFSPLFLTRHHLRWAVPHTKNSPAICISWLFYGHLLFAN